MLPLNTLPSERLKGNTGKGRQKRQVFRILAALAICISIITLYELSGMGQKNREHKEKRKRMNRIAVKEQEEIQYDDLSEQEQIDLIIAGKVNLINIHQEFDFPQRGSFEGSVTAEFCKINWKLHKDDPSRYPMFRVLIEASDCEGSTFELDLYRVVSAVREYDNEYMTKKGIDMQNGSFVKVLEPKGFVFHESRCGSTLAANSLAAMEPSMNRVYSESGPALGAAKLCGTDGSKCPPGRGAKILRDVLYLMGRTDDLSEENLFFKIQSLGSKSISVFTKAFPDTPWIYVYREPVEVLMSQLSQGGKRANCVRQFSHATRDKTMMLESINRSIDDLSHVEKCALHLSMLCDSALENLSETSTGRAVNYQNLVEKLIEHIIPDHFQILMTDERRQNILDISLKYSKGKGRKAGEWKDDTKEKEMNASNEIREAAVFFMQESYSGLEETAQSNYYEGADDFVEEQK